MNTRTEEYIVENEFSLYPVGKLYSRLDLLWIEQGIISCKIWLQKKFVIDEILNGKYLVVTTILIRLFDYKCWKHKSMNYSGSLIW